MPNFIEIGGVTRKFSKKLVDLTRNDPVANVAGSRNLRRGRGGHAQATPPVQGLYTSSDILLAMNVNCIWTSVILDQAK